MFTYTGTDALLFLNGTITLSTPQFPAHRAWNILKLPDGNVFKGQDVIVCLL
jgi:hypothetical protein